MTDDAFLGARLRVGQPKSGFRAGTDSVLLGASVAGSDPDMGGTLLDLGAGAGVAGLVALANDEALEATFVEIDPAMADLCRANIQRNGFGGRAEVIELDLTASARVRAAARLRQNHYATVLANPPYYSAGSVTMPADPGARRAHAHGPGDLEQWVKTACGAGAADAEVIFIYPASRLDWLLTVMGARLGNITVLPIAAFAGAAAGRVLVRGKNGSKAPLRLLAPLVLHGGEGEKFCPPVHQILNGNGRVHW